MLGGCSVDQRGRRRWTRLDDFGPDARNRVARGKRADRGGLLRKAPLWLAAILAFGLIGSGLVDELSGGRTELAASAATVVPSDTDFTFCHSGEGRDCVVDGDTFRHRGDRVRIAGIDAPETHPSRCAREEALGEAATIRLHQLLNGGQVRLLPSADGRDRDRHGRLLRDVEVDGRDVGAVLISEGVARAYGGGRRSWCD